ncbi:MULTISPECIES: NtaA/DmoA family FMN-dependent monooxygenase [unclassified Paenibacillus]|uniref:NtaA/DmoA family FMN-dependent monooxygenase n=1 Tax=unclassified Paenibacillus TaxID=185978 RepID=UPI0036401375
MSKRKGQLHITLSLQSTGYHPGSWRHSKARTEKLHDPAYYYRLAQTAERGKFDLLFLDHTSTGDRLSATGKEPGLLLEPFTLLGALASVTKHIGLGAAVSTSVIEPFAVARQLAALDHLSGGRTAWLASVSDHREPKRHGGLPELSRSERTERQQEFVEVAQRLWDSWEEGAVIVDREQGRYTDSDKVHLIHHAGKHFTVRGPLSIPRPPQGYPVRIGLSSALGNRNVEDSDSAELILSSRPSIREAADFYAQLKQRNALRGRFPNGVKVLTVLTPIIGATEEDARNKAAELQKLIDPEAGIALLSDLFDTDLTEYPLDGPLPVIPFLKEAVITAGLEGLTLRELSLRALELKGTKVFVGTSEQLVDWMEEWYLAYGSDGFHLQPSLLPNGLDEFVEQVIPLLQRKGLFRTEYTGNTLRDHLGLEAPAAYGPISREG